MYFQSKGINFVADYDRTLSIVAGLGYAQDGIASVMARSKQGSSYFT